MDKNCGRDVKESLIPWLSGAGHHGTGK